MDWNIGDIAVCIYSGVWKTIDGIEEWTPCPEFFHQYLVTDVSIEDDGDLYLQLNYDEFGDDIWWAVKFIKLDDPNSIKEEDTYIPTRKFLYEI